MVSGNIILSKKREISHQIGLVSDDVQYCAPYSGKPHLEKMRLALRSRYESGGRTPTPGKKFVFNVAFDEKRKEVSWIVSTCK